MRAAAGTGRTAMCAAGRGGAWRDAMSVAGTVLGVLQPLQAL
jgi:hypothetical protein